MARCRCSRERIDRVLRSIKREELDDLRDTSGKVSVKCEFCSTEYAYDDSDLDRIYASAAEIAEWPELCSACWHRVQTETP